MTLSIMLQGTGSDVGKSVLVAGLCRALVKRGMSVRPFKPQNMSNNAAVTKTGGEVGRAQALQAIACNTELSVHMNPVLLKPQSDIGAQVIVQGKVAGTSDAEYYRTHKSDLLEKVIESYDILKSQTDIVVVEGAGSPAEVNLRAHDIANMGFATTTNTPVIMIGDIDRGGVIASLVGTHALLSPQDNALIRGYIINKFRGDPTLFDNAHETIISKTGWDNIGVLPFVPAVKKLPAEDAVILDQVKSEETKNIRIAVPMLSRIANFDDLDPLTAEPDIDVRFIPPGEHLPGNADLIIIPGSKSTIADLEFFMAQGWDIDLAYHIRRGGRVLGICGGYQILGKTISDPDCVEGEKTTTTGLGYLNVNTIMEKEKTVRQTTAYSDQFNCETNGYEIHIGVTTGPDTDHPFLRDGDRTLGAKSNDGTITGAYLHGMFTDDKFRAKYLSALRNSLTGKTNYKRHVDQALDTLATKMEEKLDIDRILEIARNQEQE